MYAEESNMKIAIAHWQNRISPVFDVSDRLCLIHMSRKDILLRIHDPFGRAKEIAELGTNVLLCGAISDVLEKAILAASVQVIGFLCGDLGAVIHAFLQGRLNDGRFFMPGCYRQRQRHRFRGFRLR
jgi:hypothetical protein